METSNEYGVTVLLLSFAGVALSTLYLRRVVQAYRIYHDERAAISLGKGLGLFVIAMGLLVSAVGRFLGAHGEFAVAGLMMARGALIVLLATLVFANIRPHSEGGKDQDHEA